jgi:glycosyltransferase involved in cell wall biosynthesis
LSKLLKCPYVITEHTRPQNNFRSFIHQQLTIFGLKRATAVMAVSKLLATEVMKWSNRQVEVMPNIVETERFSVQPYPTQSIQIGFLGALNKPVKGLEVLLNAVAKLNTEFVLHIGGAGLLLNSYKSQATELGITAKCKFYGAIEPTVVPDFMASLHFFVCSSYSETFCVALAEALASGRPVVSTQCGGPEEFVNDTNGILVAVNDEETLANGINRMIRKYHTYDQLLLREQIEMRFSAESFLNRIEKIYSRVRLVKKITVIQK